MKKIDRKTTIVVGDLLCLNKNESFAGGKKYPVPWITGIVDDVWVRRSQQSPGRTIRISVPNLTPVANKNTMVNTYVTGIESSFYKPTLSHKFWFLNNLSGVKNDENKL